MQAVSEIVAPEEWGVSHAFDIVEVKLSERRYEAVNGDLLDVELFLEDFEYCHGEVADEEMRFDAFVALQIYWSSVEKRL